MTVIDANDHRKVVTSKITEPVPINIHLDYILYVKCFDDKKGEIDVTVTGGTAPYSYKWSNGATSQDLKNVGAGTYDLIVSDQFGCENSLQEVQVNQPALLTSRIVSVDNVKCNGDYEGGYFY